MKEKIVICFILFLIFFAVIVLNLAKTNSSLSMNLKSGKPVRFTDQNEEITEKKDISRSQSSIFIPYWALPQSEIDIHPYDRLLYFGMSIDENGIQKNDAGFKQVESFQNVIKTYTGKKTLVVRMLDSQKNSIILNDENIQDAIITEINDAIKKNSFSELALDLELSGVLLTDNTSKINFFVQKLYTLKNKHYSHFSVILYGDVLYRSRPFDIKTIGQYCDEIMIMAYDFSKPYGQPGPNMPFSRTNLDEKDLLQRDYGYDFKQMISDYSSRVSPRKLTVIYGMYGYDWTLNKQGTPLKRADVVTVNQINKLIKIEGQISHVKIISQKSKEKRIEYVDSESNRHVIYYEDPESAQVKSDYLKQRGIDNVAYWAYSYF